MAGTREDATLIVELAKWGAMIGLQTRAGRSTRTTSTPGAADALDDEVQTILVWHETIGTLVKNSSWTATSSTTGSGWPAHGTASGPAALAAREKAGVPELFANFEQLAKGQS